MADNDNLVLEHLRAIRSDLTSLKDGQREVRAELGSIRGYLSAMHSDIAVANTRVDNLENRIHRIEQRLDLRDN